MYKAFSDPKNIEKMVRQLDVFPEEETLEATLIDWKGNPYRRNFGHWVKYVSAKTKNTRELYLYWDRKIEDEFLEEIAGDILKNPAYFDKLENYFKINYQKFEEFTDKIFKENEIFFENKSSSELIALFDVFNRYHKSALAAYYVVYDLALLLPRIVRGDLRKNFMELSDPEIEKELHFFASTGISSVVVAERLEFLENLDKIQKIFRKNRDLGDKKIQRIIFRHWYKFCGCSYNHAGVFVLLSDYQAKFRKSMRLSAKKEIAEIKREKAREKETVKKALQKFRKYPETLWHITWLRKFMGYRNCDEEYYHSHFLHALNLFNEISRRLNLGGDDMWLLSKSEIINSIRGKAKAEKIIAERKKKGYTIKQMGNKIKVLTGVKKEDWHERVIEKTDILKGMVAYKGYVKGRAKITFNPAGDIKKIGKGDILVTSMTTPDFVPLIKKASAIITDEGGLLCHAAIVSRELKKPCIIGTKIATKVIKDGDLVEVDANKGIVRILERK